MDIMKGKTSDRTLLNNLRVSTHPEAGKAREIVGILAKESGETRQSVIVRSIIFAAENSPRYKDYYLKAKTRKDG